MLSPAEIAAITAGLTEIVKSFGVPSKWCPIVAICIAIAFSVLVAWKDGTDYLEAVLAGLLIGLTTTGLYKAGKEISAATKKKNN